MKRKFNPYEIKIIQCLERYGTAMSITEIQKKTGLSWKTIEKHADTLTEEKILTLYDGRYELNY
jgi:DNA-binding IclR family transcriptional regulator